MPALVVISSVPLSPAAQPVVCVRKKHVYKLFVVPLCWGIPPTDIPSPGEMVKLAASPIPDTIESGTRTLIQCLELSIPVLSWPGNKLKY